MTAYRDRREAGQSLAQSLRTYGNSSEVVVLGLPRGGVVVAEEVAKALQVPLDVILLRKLPYPPQPELAIGAVAEDGSIFINQEFQNAIVFASKSPDVSALRVYHPNPTSVNEPL